MAFYNKRENFTDEQMAQESGGRQFDTSGKPLVGRYRSGKTPPAGKEAYGAGQMQIGTAREAAIRAGIPWDQQKFMRDKDYNLSLADAHMGYLKKKYGDEKLAKAAYHSGTGTVDAAIARYGREGFEQGLGPEGRAYVGFRGKGGRTPTPSQPYKAPTATAGETTAMSDSRFDITDPFAEGTASGIKGALGEVNKRTDTLDAMLGNVIGELNATQEAQLQARQQVNDAKAGVFEEMRSANLQLIEQARPLFQTREAIARRKSELAGMNPLERAIKGTFDPNYNGTDLRARDQAATQELQVLDEKNKYIGALQESVTKIMEAEYADQASFWDLYSGSLKEDVAIMNQSVAVADAKFSDALKGLDAQTGLIRAQGLARQDTLSQMSEGQVGVALEQAKENPQGHAIVNGVPIGVGELTQLQNNYRDQAMALESRQLALESNKIQLADQYEDQAIKNMSPLEIDAAINNGGVHKGQQLDVTKLAQAKQAVNAIKGQQLQELETNNSFGASKQLTRMIKDTMIGTSRRMQAMMGEVPLEQRNLMEGTAAELQLITKGIEEAEAKGVAKEFYAGQVAKKQMLLKKQDELITDTAKRWAGGNKEMTAVGEAWLRGQPMTSEVAIRGLITMARNGKPAGMKLDGVTAQVFKRVEQVVRSADSPKPGTDVAAMMANDPASQAEKTRKLVQDVRGAVESTYNDISVTAVLDQTPELAAKVRVAGRVHPFARVRGEDFKMALAYGEQEARKRAGVQPSQPIPSDKIAQAQADEIQFTLEALDARASEPGFVPSRAYADLMGNSQYRAQVANMNQNMGRGSFGGFVAQSAAGGDFNTQFDVYGRNVVQGYQAMQAAKTRNKIMQQRSLLADPWDRSRSVMVLGGVDAKDADLLLRTIRPLVLQAAGPAGQVEQPGMIQEYLSGPTDDQLVARHDVFETVQDIIMNRKLPDPALDKIRQRAAAKWMDSRNGLDRTVQSLSRSQ
jgi:hypothetical protein